MVNEEEVPQKETKKVVQQSPFPQDADLDFDKLDDSGSEESSDNEESEDSDEIELMREYAKIKREREIEQ